MRQYKIATGCYGLSVTACFFTLFQMRYKAFVIVQP